MAIHRLDLKRSDDHDGSINTGGLVFFTGKGSDLNPYVVDDKTNICNLTQLLYYIPSEMFVLKKYHQRDCFAIFQYQGVQIRAEFFGLYWLDGDQHIFEKIENSYNLSFHVPFDFWKITTLK